MITRFKSGCRYRHKSCIDVDIYVVKAYYITPKRCVLRVLYINRNYQKGNFVIDQRPNRIKFYPNTMMWDRVL